MNRSLNMVKGKKGEDIATDYLEQKGYEILEKNFRYQHVEIDVIAKKNNTLHFVEVKYRSQTFFGQGREAVDRTKINNIKKAINAYLEQMPQEIIFLIQIDAVCILEDTKTNVITIECIEDIF